MTVQERAPLLSAPHAGALTGNSTRAMILRYLNWAYETGAKRITVYPGTRSRVQALARAHYPTLLETCEIVEK